MNYLNVGSVVTATKSFPSGDESLSLIPDKVNIFYIHSIQPTRVIYSILPLCVFFQLVS